MSTQVKMSESILSKTTPKTLKKCRNFLTSVLSPKSSSRSRKISKSSLSLEETKNRCDALYSTIDDLQPKVAEISESNIKPASSNYSEPIYATIKKKKKQSLVFEVNNETNDAESQVNSSKFSEVTNEESNDLEQIEYEEQLEFKLKELRNNLIKMQDENNNLKKHIHDLQKEEKMKEDIIHAQLRLKITEFETETRKEINSLIEKIKILDDERKHLSLQLNALHEENLQLKKNNTDLIERNKRMIAPEEHAKILDNHAKLLEELKSKYEETKHLKEQQKITQEEKNLMNLEIQALKDKLIAFQAKITNLENKHEEITSINKHYLKQLDKAKKQEQETQNLLLTLLQQAENITLERDILLKKANFQENQQKDIHNKIIAYSLNIGRLEEHIMNMSKKNAEDLLKLKSSLHQNSGDEMKQAYEKQIKILREKILIQNNKLNELSTDKGKLEMQLEGLWQAICNDNPQFLLEHIKNTL